LWGDVRRDLLDASGLVAATLGTARRDNRLVQIRRRQLLGEQLLGRRCCGHRRSTGPGRDWATSEKPPIARCTPARAWTRNARQYPSLWRVGFSCALFVV